jgi:hypothetical protein
MSRGALRRGVEPGQSVAPHVGRVDRKASSNLHHAHQKYVSRAGRKDGSRFFFVIVE